MREIDFPPANHRKRQACKLSASKNGWFLFCLQKRVYVCPRCSVYHWLIRNSVQILDCFYKSINSYKPCFISSSSYKSPEPILSLMVIVQIIVIFVFGICTLMLAVIFKCWNSQKVSLCLAWLPTNIGLWNKRHNRRCSMMCDNIQQWQSWWSNSHLYRPTIAAWHGQRRRGDAHNT